MTINYISYNVDYFTPKNDDIPSLDTGEQGSQVAGSWQNSPSKTSNTFAVARLSWEFGIFHLHNIPIVVIPCGEVEEFRYQESSYSQLNCE